VPVLLDRIRSRGREIERGVTAEYLGLLESFYDNWASGFDLSPVLTIKSDDLDFVHKPRHLETVMRRIHSILAGKEEMEFPKGN